MGKSADQINKEGKERFQRFFIKEVVTDQKGTCVKVDDENISSGDDSRKKLTEKNNNLHEIHVSKKPPDRRSGGFLYEDFFGGLIDSQYFQFLCFL